MNLYGYVGNDPIDFSDRRGLGPDATTDQIHAFKFKASDFGPAPSRNSQDVGYVAINDQGTLVPQLDSNFKADWSDQPIVLQAAIAHEQDHIDRALASGSTVASKCNAGQYLGDSGGKVTAANEYLAYETEQKYLNDNINSPGLSVDDKIAIGQRLGKVNDELAIQKQRFIDASAGGK